MILIVIELGERFSGIGKILNSGSALEATTEPCAGVSVCRGKSPLFRVGESPTRNARHEFETRSFPESLGRRGDLCLLSRRSHRLGSPAFAEATAWQANSHEFGYKFQRREQVGRVTPCAPPIQLRLNRRAEDCPPYLNPDDQTRPGLEFRL